MEFYRYYDLHDRFGTHIDLSTYVLLRETNCGYWIIHNCYKNNSDIVKEKHKRWIPRSSKKRFAYPTKHEALNSFKKRKEMQIKWAKHNEIRATAALSRIPELEAKIGDES